MSRRRRNRQEDEPDAQPPAHSADEEAWDAPEFRRSVLITLAFVAAPAVVMLALGELTYAAAWLGVGVLVVVYEARHQIRGLWRALRSGRQ